MKLRFPYFNDSDVGYLDEDFLDENEKIVSEVLFECATKTSCDKIEVNGETVEKFHVSAIDAKDYILEYGGETFIRAIIL